MHEDNHGQTTAAWTGVAIMLVGSALACWGVMFGPEMLLWIGLAVAVVGALVWYGMERAGMGTNHPDGDEPARTGRPISPPASTTGGHDR